MAVSILSGVMLVVDIILFAAMCREVGRAREERITLEKWMRHRRAAVLRRAVR